MDLLKQYVKEKKEKKEKLKSQQVFVDSKIENNHENNSKETKKKHKLHDNQKIKVSFLEESFITDQSFGINALHQQIIWDGLEL
jgi:hypothetical protein